MPTHGRASSIFQHPPLRAWPVRRPPRCMVYNEASLWGVRMTKGYRFEPFKSTDSRAPAGRPTGRFSRPL